MNSNLAKTDPSPFLKIVERDLMAELLRDSRSPNTRRTYARSLKDFFLFASGAEPTPELIGQFLQLERMAAIQLVLAYKARLIERGLTEATVNVRLSAIKSLVAFAQRADRCSWNLDVIRQEKAESYRDTTGVSPAEFKKLFQAVDRTTLKGKRDYALLRLLWDNVLRREEICSSSVGDFDPATATLQILGKGKGTQKEPVTISSLGVQAIQDWLMARPGSLHPADPLFIALDRAHFGHRLTGDGLYYFVSQLAKKAGFSKTFSPHRCRHSGTTASLEANNGNIRETQKLTRHRKPETVMRYDDNRRDAQGKVTATLASLMDI